MYLTISVGKCIRRPLAIQVLHNPILAYARPPPLKKATPALKLAILALSYVSIEWPCVDSIIQ